MHMYNPNLDLANSKLKLNLELCFTPKPTQKLGTVELLPLALGDYAKEHPFLVPEEVPQRSPQKATLLPRCRQEHLEDLVFSQPRKVSPRISIQPPVRPKIT